MRGGRKQAKLACGRPLDGRVRARVGQHAHTYSLWKPAFLTSRHPDHNELGECCPVYGNLDCFAFALELSFAEDSLLDAQSA
jgi:hypothetical protein